MVVAATLASGCVRVRGPADEMRGADDPIPTVTPYEVAKRFISPVEAGRHVRFLAADARRGRATGSRGLERAAAWLAAELGLAGLEPAGDHGGYLQYWPYEDARHPRPAPDSVEQVPNVMARIPGSSAGRADEYVVVLAHFDHLGMGEPTEDGDSVYNGADDNASGVAAFVEVARIAGMLSEVALRPILFLAVSGGEQDRAGTRWFVEHPAIPLDDVVAVLDLDMIGRNHPDTIGVLGSDSLAAVIARLAAESPDLGLTVTRDPPGQDRVLPGDHTIFADRGIPAVRFFAGIHDDYHTPSDEAGAVDTDKVARVARLAFLTLHHLVTQVD